MSNLATRLLAPLALAGALLTANAASAQSLLALVGDSTIAWVSPKNWKATGTVNIKGAKLVGFDVRPADGMLYGVTADNWIVTIDPKTGAVTKKAELSTKLPAGVAVTVDFNPVVDRMRILAADGTNLRVNVDDGKVIVDGMLKFAETDMHKGEKPNIVAGAYSNSLQGRQGSGALRHRRDDRRAVPPGPAERRRALRDRQARHQALRPGRLQHRRPAKTARTPAGSPTTASSTASTCMTGMAKLVGPIGGIKGKINDIAWWPAEAKTM